MALAQQKRMAFKEQVTFFATSPHAAGVRLPGPQAIDVNAGYDITDEPASRSGSSARTSVPACSARPSTSGPRLAATGQERSQAVALLRRFIDIPFLPIHFDFADRDRAIVLASNARHRCATATPSRARPAPRLPASPPPSPWPRRPDGALPSDPPGGVWTRLAFCAMRVHLGSDHAGLELKDHLSTWLRDHGYEPVDHGPFVYDAARRLPGVLPAGRRGRGGDRARAGQPRRRDRRLRQRRADRRQQGDGRPLRAGLVARRPPRWPASTTTPTWSRSAAGCTPSTR